MQSFKWEDYFIGDVVLDDDGYWEVSLFVALVEVPMFVPPAHSAVYAEQSANKMLLCDSCGLLY